MRWIVVSSVLVGVTALAVYAAAAQEHYMLLSFVMTFLAMVPFFIRFEKKQLHARVLVFIALLAAVAAVSRVPFAVIPNVQPTSFIVIITGLALGAESGFMVGAVAALVSNLFLGQGVWTPFQMLCWGLMGLSAGLLRPMLNMRLVLMLFGFVWGIVFGGIMNVLSLVNLVGKFSWVEFLAWYSTSIYFDLMHAVANVFLLCVFGPAFLKIITRFRDKYGFFSSP